jgi:hypothetical protein
MAKKKDKQPATRYYFVDEAGDSVIFRSTGGVAIGKQGCSRFFILGLLEVPYPYVVCNGLEDLRRKFLADPYFKGVPSFDPSQGKIAEAFHATDDLPEVRREVFGLLRKFDNLRFFAVVRDKKAELNYIHSRQVQNPSYRYNPNDLYDKLVRRLFRDRLHKSERVEVCFAKRGQKPRTQALYKALLTARANFYKKWGIESQSPIIVISERSRENTCLQAVDYYLWALQRLYERKEDRYIRYIQDNISLIVDMDDRRRKPYGEYYDKKRPLNLAALEGRLD